MSSSRKYDWVKTHKKTGYLFFATPLDVNADAKITYQLVKDVQHYQVYSEGHIQAQAQQVTEGAAIAFDMQVHGCCGTTTVHSDEKIILSDENATVIGWGRKLPFTPKPTERYFWVEKTAENKCRLYSGLWIQPGIEGFFTDKCLRADIEQAFDALQIGIKNAAESKITCSK